MALLRESLIAWKSKQTLHDTITRWNVLSFDAVVTEGHQGENVVTQYPVDSGFNVSDHTIRKNRTFSMDAIISNISMPVMTSRQDFEGAYKELLTYVGDAHTRHPYKGIKKYGRAAHDNEDLLVQGLTAEVSMDKIDDALQVIQDLVSTGTLVHVITMRKLYKNCVIHGYAASNSVSDAYCLPIVLKMEELNVIDLETGGATQTIAKDSEGPPLSAFERNASTLALTAILAAVIAKQTAEAFKQEDHRELAPRESTDTKFTYEQTEFTIGKVDAKERYLVDKNNGEERYLNVGDLVQPFTRAHPTVPNALMLDFIPLLPQTDVLEIAVKTEADEGGINNLYYITAITDTSMTLRTHPDFTESVEVTFEFDKTIHYWRMEAVGLAFDKVVADMYTSLSWREGTETKSIDSIPVKAGVDMLAQESLDLPAMVAINKDDPKADPTNINNLKLFLVQDYEKYYLGVE